MAQIKQNPEKLRQFADRLLSHSSFWQSAVGDLSSHLSILRSTWQDEQFNDFATEVASLKHELDKFSEETRKVVIELQSDAEKLDIYRNA